LRREVGVALGALADWRLRRELADRLRQAHPAVISGYHLNKRHWNTVTLDGSLSDEMIDDMVENSYDLVVSALPKARQRALGWHSDA
jgi:predicted DNA-binding protein (MmcQ/YjbR family)